MKTILQLIVISLVLGSCSSLKKTANNDLGQYDEVYYTPADEQETVQKKSEPSPVSNSTYETKTPPAEPDYRKYKEGEPEEIVRQPENSSSSSRNENYSYSDDDDYYYDDDDDFSYGRSLRRLRYGDGYRDGYGDAMADNYNRGGGFYNSYYSNPSWGWNRPLRSSFWVGYNTWNGWNVGYNYGYPAWGWRTSYYPVYNSFCNPWYGYSGGWGYYSNPYYGGTPYGYYDPFYSPYYGSWGYYNYGYGGYYGGYGGYNNYYNPWYRPVYVYTNNNVGNNGTPGKGKMTGPRETIGSNSPTKSRNDQISPRSRGGMVQQIAKVDGNTYDPKNDKRAGMVGNTDPKDTRGRMMDNGKEATATPENGKAGRTVPNTNSPDKTTPSDRATTAPDNGTTVPGNNGTGSRGRTIDRSTPEYGRSNETPSRRNETTTEPDRNTNSGGTPPTSRSRSYEPDNTYEPPREEPKTRSRSNNEPTERNRGNEQPSNNNYQKREEPRSTPAPRTYDGGGSRGGGSNTPAPSGGGNSGGSSNTPRGRGR